MCASAVHPFFSRWGQSVGILIRFDKYDWLAAFHILFNSSFEQLNLPTGGTAKFYSALGVYDFVKYSSYSYYPKGVLETFKDDVQTFAKSEGLDAHANSIAVRFEEE